MDFTKLAMLGGNALLIPPYYSLLWESVVVRVLFPLPSRGGEVKGWVRSEEQKTGGQEGRLKLEAKMLRCIEAKLLSIINFVRVLPK